MRRVWSAAALGALLTTTVMVVPAQAAPIGQGFTITEADLKVLADALEEESTTDNDYFIDQATLDVIGDGRASDHLMHLLRGAVGSSDGVDIRWERKA